eukprot:TRINITY_DN191_c0_g1_i3.p1 TRINITY_DN191_c0_g1~~TRINITY_DN191_c0_g1_i3.p1  ORF type:complete len:457 (+),score=81.36 TRINITY_DN191_c0_g1_i3:317-1687(+)
MGEYPNRWSDIDKILTRDGPYSMSNFKPDTKNKEFLLEDCRVLVIGAGGLGCEILKNLSLSGFRNIDVIDMDEIDYSNLNRQFLFREGDVGKPKAEIAAAFVNKRIPGANVKGHFAKIQDKPDEWYTKFHVVVAGLDSIPARRWINETLCKLATKDDEGEWDRESIIPLVDGGSEGFMGQARVIFPRITPCFECLLDLFPPDPLNFQECTLVSIPRQPEHCISWAKQFAWEEDPDRKGKPIDGDNPDHITWLFEKAEARAKQFNIEGVTWKLTQTVIKRIIPAVAFTNAVIAAACANEAFKIVTNSSKFLKNWWMYNGNEGVYSSTTNFQKEEEATCIVCSTEPIVYHFDPHSTLGDIIKMLIEDKGKFLMLTNPSLVRKDENDNSYPLYFPTGFMAPKTKENLGKRFGDLINENDTLFITNKTVIGEKSAATKPVMQQQRERNYIVRVLFKSQER